MSRTQQDQMSQNERLVQHVHELERLTSLRDDASEALRDGFERAKTQGFDVPTLKVVLKLRTLTPSQRRERRALEAIYMAALAMLDGEPLPEEARRRLDKPADEDESTQQDDSPSDEPQRMPSAAPRAAQQPLALKDPDEARAEGGAAAEAGKRIYDNPYGAGDPCRAAWDEGWCAQRKSHGMDLPEAYQRRTTKPAEKPSEPATEPPHGDAEGDDLKKGAA
ncbi:GapR family DNA-binding domain-containing protein [Luteitalea sp.]|uniref:GapR family DNA-binding domain-containing protein n=1 Tax=Luteitalea sp. TaxID=2004800 RepID=UPI0025BC3068|nr:GapR family DNA-binding domain-containing protein [Luteitalea sp.]